MRFTEQVAIVTGGGSGIGRATAERLAREGASVGVLDVDAASAGAVAASLETAGGTAVPEVADVGDETAVGNAFDEVERQLGIATVVVHAAGVLYVASALDTSLDDFDRVIRTNLRGAFLVSTAAARRRRAEADRSSPCRRSTRCCPSPTRRCTPR